MPSALFGPPALRAPLHKADDVAPMARMRPAIRSGVGPRWRPSSRRGRQRGCACPWNRAHRQRATPRPVEVHTRVKRSRVTEIYSSSISTAIFNNASWPVRPSTNRRVSRGYGNIAHRPPGRWLASMCSLTRSVEHVDVVAAEARLGLRALRDGDRILPLDHGQGVRRSGREDRKLLIAEEGWCRASDQDCLPRPLQALASLAVIVVWPSPAGHHQIGGAGFRS